MFKPNETGGNPSGWGGRKTRPPPRVFSWKDESWRREGEGEEAAAAAAVPSRSCCRRSEPTPPPTLPLTRRKNKAAAPSDSPPTLLPPPLLSVEDGVNREYHPPHRILSMYFRYSSFF
jgi:hypothetical protein